MQLTALASDPKNPPLVLVTHHAEEIPPGFTHGGLMRAGTLMAAGAPAPDHHVGERVGLLRRGGDSGVQ